MTTTAVKHQWTGDDEHGFELVGRTQPTLPPAVYKPREMGAPCLYPVKLKSDQPIVVDDGTAQAVMATITDFLDKQDLYKEFALLHKRGILLQGPPGTGKTMSCQMVAREFVERKGYAILTDICAWHRAATAIGMIRAAHPTTPILSIIEDVDLIADQNMHNNDYFKDFLDWLDGNSQTGSIVHLATTNFVKNLDQRLTNRPSRFDEVIYVGPPSEKARSSYITQLLPAARRDETLISRLTAVSSGLMLAHLRELVISVCVLGQSEDSVAARLKGMFPDPEAEEVTTTAALVTQTRAPAGTAARKRAAKNTALVPVSRKIN